MIGQGVIFFLLVTALICFLFQRLLRQQLTRDRYFYVRDLSLAAAAGLLALWSGSRVIQWLAAASLGALYLGLMDQVMPRKGWNRLCFLPALAFACWGARIQFLALPGGYYYMQGVASVVITTLWMVLFPLLFRAMDGVPGFAGHMLAVSLCLMSFVAFFSRPVTYEAFLVCCGALTLVGAYWSRLGHHFRQLGAGLCNFWGTLIGGVALIGVSKAATLTTLLVVPLAFYALPLCEASLGLVNRAFTSKTTSRVPYLYSRFLDRGVDHPAAVRLMTGLCMLLGLATALLRMHPAGWGWTIISASVALLLVVLILLVSHRKKTTSTSKGLWGIPLDGISMNYALSRVRAWVHHPGPLRQIVTLNALGINDATKDARYFELLQRTDLNLPDGAGLVWAMRLNGLSVVERVSGCDFMARFCRLAASEGIGVFLFGGRPGVAERAAIELQRQNPGLVISGTEHGYHRGPERDAVAQKVKASGAGVLFVALGMPAQEFWIDAHRRELSGLVAVGVGGSFDVYAGDLKRAPRLWSKLGLEWLYRLLQEPKRFKRDLGLAAFVFKTLKTKFFS